MNILMKKTADLKPYEKNAKKHPEKQINNVAASIELFGFVLPVVIDKNNIIVIGHCRTLAAKKLGLEEVPCVIVDELTDEQIRTLRIIDNKTNESPWDTELLMMELEFCDMSAFDFPEFDKVEVKAESKEVPVPEVKVEEPAITQKGDIWIMGNHRLICGDSTDKATIERLMNGQKADLVVTDPPYNVDYEGKTKDKLKIQNDKWTPEEFRIFLNKAFHAMENVLKPGGAFYVWYASREVVNFSEALREAGLTVKQELIWNKNAMVMGRKDYQWKHEPCLYGWKEGAGHYFIKDRKQTTVIDEEELNFDKMTKAELVDFCKTMINTETSILDCQKPSKSSLHPTMKPVSLFSRLIRNSSKSGENVLDIFGGSGTTIISCEEMGRHGFACELDEHYCDVIVKRWEEMTGLKAVKE